MTPAESDPSKTFRFSALIDPLFTAGPPDLGFQPRPGTLSAPEIRMAVADLAAHPSLPGPLTPERQALLEAAALLWHDHREKAHDAAQAREGDADFDLLHAVLHRREGDYPNAEYWFAEAGKHPCYVLLEALLQDDARLSEDAGLHRPWSPSDFVSRVRLQAGKAGREREALRLIQAAETRALAEWIFRSC